MKLINSFLCALICAPCFAAPAAAASAATNTAPGNLLQIIVSLVVVVALMIILSIGFKKFGLDRMHANFPIKVIGGISVGNNQRIMIIEAGEEWVVLGVTPHTISALTSMPRGETTTTTNVAGQANQVPFSAWMQRTMEKYRDKKT